MVCSKVVARLDAVWQAREELAALADESQSWEQVVERLKQFPWYGGSGFHAKEAVQDMLNTVTSQACDGWCIYPLL